ncbi:MAG: hypothetical protein LBR72_09305 [Oscillospiraceae bacterium]|jgi:hypothetical protein|nr:hypothetical protein [Oscillospiraceae bacterium]
MTPMLRNGTYKCSCPHTECKRNGKCDECAAFHRGKTRCFLNGEVKAEPEKEQQ